MFVVYELWTCWLGKVKLFLIILSDECLVFSLLNTFLRLFNDEIEAHNPKSDPLIYDSEQSL